MLFGCMPTPGPATVLECSQATTTLTRAGSLPASHPGAAASLREGLEETLTVQALGMTGALYRTLHSTNPIENLNGLIAHRTRNVKCWKDGYMVLRWVASALANVATRMRKLRGCTAAHR